MGFATDSSKTVVLVLFLFCLAVWFLLHHFVFSLALFHVLVFVSVLFSFVITSFGEGRAGHYASRAFLLHLSQLMRLWYLSHPRSLARAFAVRTHEVWK